MRVKGGGREEGREVGGDNGEEAFGLSGVYGRELSEVGVSSISVVVGDQKVPQVRQASKKNCG